MDRYVERQRDRYKDTLKQTSGDTWIQDPDGQADNIQKINRDICRNTEKQTYRYSLPDKETIRQIRRQTTN